MSSFSRLAIGFGLVLIVTSSVGAASSLARGQREAASHTFRGPGGNVVCGYFSGPGLPALLECGVDAQLSPPPPRPSARGCGGLDFAGNRIRLGAKGAAYGFCSGDAGVLAYLRTAPRLRPGATWHGGPFTCTASVAWISCSNTSRRGFSISRFRWRAH